MIRLAHLTGLALQMLIMGTLLYAAAGRIVAVEAGARIFRYQGF
jgi:hypothetical protein